MPLHLRDRIESSGETGARLFDLDGSRGLPYALREGIDLNSSSFFVLETDWNRQEHRSFRSGSLSFPMRLFHRS